MSLKLRVSQNFCGRAFLRKRQRCDEHSALGKAGDFDECPRHLGCESAPFVARKSEVANLDSGANGWRFESAAANTFITADREIANPRYCEAGVPIFRSRGSQGLAGDRREVELRLCGRAVFVDSDQTDIFRRGQGAAPFPRVASSGGLAAPNFQLWDVDRPVVLPPRGVFTPSP